VIPAAFDYHRASSVDDAVAALKANEDAKVLAGGHSLIPLLRLRFARPAMLVDVGALDELRYVREDGDRIAIGALTRHSELAREAVLIEGCTMLADAAGQIGDPQVRHRGTIGGAIAHGDPVSDIPAVLVAVDADLVARGPDGERTIPASAFFEGVYQTALAPDEMLTEIRVPAVEAGRYMKFVRRAQDWATVGAAVARVGGRTQIGLASMGATPLRAHGVEEALAAGASPADAAARTAEGTSPPSDVSGSSEYRAHLAQVLVRRGLESLA
jgi:aerobic carbon-monoxide dehydrogenase medium subunit